MATQSEQILEDNLVIQLISQGYAPVAVTDEATMLANLKAQLEAFNGMTLTAGEFTSHGKCNVESLMRAGGKESVNGRC